MRKCKQNKQSESQQLHSKKSHLTDRENTSNALPNAMVRPKVARPPLRVVLVLLLLFVLLPLPQATRTSYSQESKDRAILSQARKQVLATIRQREATTAARQAQYKYVGRRLPEQESTKKTSY